MKDDFWYFFTSIELDGPMCLTSIFYLLLKIFTCVDRSFSMQLTLHKLNPNLN